MPCRGICSRLPGVLRRKANYDAGWWCRNCEVGFSIGPRCGCCKNNMRAAERHSHMQERIPMEQRPNVIILDARIGVWRPISGSYWEIFSLDSSCKVPPGPPFVLTSLFANIRSIASYSTRNNLPFVVVVRDLSAASSSKSLCKANPIYSCSIEYERFAL